MKAKTFVLIALTMIYLMMSETIANKGKTYDDLADILKTANNKLQNE
jgi:hypothetical protein